MVFSLVWHRPVLLQLSNEYFADSLERGNGLACELPHRLVPADLFVGAF